MSTDELTKFISECIARGVTTFDTAEIYGETKCEKQLGLVFKSNPSFRNKIEIVTKTGIFKEQTSNGKFTYYDTSYDRIIQSCKESIERLGCEYIDLYLIHREDPQLDPWEVARAFRNLKAQGLVRDFGVSNFDPFKFEALNKAMNGELVTNQIEWNPLCFEHFNSGMIDLLLKLKISPMVWSPLAGGDLFTSQDTAYQSARSVIESLAKKYQVEPATIVYSWLLSHPVNAMPISGSNKLDRLDHAIKGLEVTLEHWEWYQIYAASGQQKIK